jgi:Transcription factor WhiB
MTTLPSPRRRSAWAGLTARSADPADLSADRLAASMVLAECVDSVLEPDDWFPVATNPARARAEAACALALCAVCPVRAQCLELSMRLWDAGGQYGIWGGLVEADRAAARAAWLAGVPATDLLSR